MNWIDYLVVIIYSVGFLGLGYLFKENKSAKDYFLGGQNMGWFPLSLSTMATQLSAISFISAPAFVGLAVNGGMKWLSFEFAVPLAMIGIMIVIIPPLYRANIVSIYEFVEQRFATSTRITLSVVFQISRSLATGVMVYTVAMILQTVLNINFNYTLLIISLITLIYSFQGGMKAVVWGDAIQMIILFGGLIICLVYGWNLLQSSGEFSGFTQERLQVLDFSNFGIHGGQFGFFPMVLGGLFLYVSYYGTDQTQAQRLLSAKNEKTIKKLLLANGLLRFPVVLVYCIMGLIIGSLVYIYPDFLHSISEITRIHYPEQFTLTGIKSDLMIPVFIIKYLPHGLIGILIVGIMSAAMSSLSSTINSLGAVSIEDFFNRGTKKLSQERYIKFSKYAVLIWGVICIAAAYLFGGSKGTVIELINIISSQFYGPILATFVIAFLIKKVNSIGMNIGIIGGVLINLLIKYLFPDIFWIWFNLTGFVITLILSLLFSKIKETENNNNYNKKIISFKIYKKDFYTKEVFILVSFFAVIIILSWWLPYILSNIKG